jgi:hypothetical protein
LCQHQVERKTGTNGQLSKKEQDTDGRMRFESFNGEVKAFMDTEFDGGTLVTVVEKDHQYAYDWNVINDHIKYIRYAYNQTVINDWNAQNQSVHKICLGQDSDHRTLTIIGPLISAGNTAVL